MSQEISGPSEYRDAAVAFLIAGQSPDGAWRDFDLEPGASDAWVTAFVALVLERCRPRLATPAAGAVGLVVHRGVCFLVDSARADSMGLPCWGYNGQAPVDADSTAHAALLLQAVGHPWAPAATQALLAFALPDGGFATFRRRDPTNPWGQSHSDVSAVALRALVRGGAATPALVESGLAFLDTHRQGASHWLSYWWTTPLLATVAALRVYRNLGRAPNCPNLLAYLHAVGSPAAPLDAALALACRQLVGDAGEVVETLAQGLKAMQRADGSWDTAPRLRVPPQTANSITQNAASPAGEDPHRLYTTASVLHALLGMQGAGSSRGET